MSNSLQTMRAAVSAHRQRGIVMWVALVVLIVMSLAGIAMLRQMGSGISVAGNVAFKQNATSTADVGIEAARQWYLTTGLDLNINQPLQGYYATWSGTWGSTVDPTQFDWRASNSVTVTAGAGAADIGGGNTSQYIIQRLCRDTGSVQAPTQVCSDLEDDTTRDKGSFDDSKAPLSPSLKPYYRVTSRVLGPRNTVSFTQVILN